VAAYFHRIGEVLRTAPQRASFATLRLGVDGDGERKSMEPWRRAHVPNPEGVKCRPRAAERTSLGARNGPTVKCAARPARYALAAMTAREPVTDWISTIRASRKAGHALRGRATTVFRAQSARSPICQVAAA